MGVGSAGFIGFVTIVHSLHGFHDEVVVGPRALDLGGQGIGSERHIRVIQLAADRRMLG